MTIFPEEITKETGLNYFKGKVCTILVDSLADFQSKMSNEEVTQSFTGYVNHITPQGVCITDLIDKTRNWFFRDHIVGIREAQVFDPDNPKDQEQIAVIQKAMEIKESKAPEPPKVSKVEQMESVGKESAFVDLADLQRLAKKSKNNLQ